MTMRITLTTVWLLVTCSAASTPPCAAAVGQAAQQAPSLDQLLAPIALYPDPLLAQILISASNPAKMGALHEWMQSNQTLKGSELQDAAVKAGFDASFVALILFPQVVTMMAEQLDWTTRLGEAFAADRSAVFGSIQRLRHKAKDIGTLKSTKQQEVTSQTTPAGEDVIVIEPANPQVVYVPQYNPQVVYTQAPTSTTVVIQEDDDSTEAVAAGLIGFTAGIAIGAAVNNSYYYGPYGWHGGGYMYNDAWDDYYDRREDAREDWQDHREDLSENRGDRAEDAREQRTDRQESTQQQRTDRQQTRQETRPESQTQRTTERSGEAQATTSQAKTERGSGNYEARGHGDTDRSAGARERSGGGSDAFSGYSSKRSTQASSSRGKSSRGSRGGGGGGRRR